VSGRAPLAGRRAVVTGASRGIGRATAQALAAAGVRVALVARDKATLERLAAELGEEAFAAPCDVEDAGAIAAVTSAIADRFGGAPDLLVNNAGAFALATVEETSPSAFLTTVNVNLVAPFLFVHAFLRGMRERRGGHIVTIGSIADRMVFPENGAYAASKHGVRALHEVMRTELRGSGVRVTLVSPGPVNTALWDAVDPDTRAGFTPRSAMLSAAAVADAILYALTAPEEMNVDEIRVTRS
jgi:NADP-dependent 3-hydroxy acid dehydrogenase YdfG